MNSAEGKVDGQNQKEEEDIEKNINNIVKKKTSPKHVALIKGNSVKNKVGNKAS